LTRRRQRHTERPSLIDLFDDIQRIALNRMEADGLELHPTQHFKRVAGLLGYPTPDGGSRVSDLIHQGICVGNAAND
jgi:hypothetical protein